MIKISCTDFRIFMHRFVIAKHVHAYRHRILVYGNWCVWVQPPGHRGACAPMHGWRLCCGYVWEGVTTWVRVSFPENFWDFMFKILQSSAFANGVVWSEGKPWWLSIPVCLNTLTMRMPFPCIPAAFQQWERCSHVFPLDMTPGLVSHYLW